MAKRKTKKSTVKKTKTTKTKTVSPKKTKTVKKPTVPVIDDNPSSYRVYSISSLVKDAVSQRPEGQTIRSLLHEAINDENTGISHIVTVLHSLSLGFEIGPEGLSKVRWSLFDSDLAKLRQASAVTKCDGNSLLLAALQCHLNKKGGE